jgi:hypothetical protein
MPRRQREEFLSRELHPLEFLADRTALYLAALHIIYGVWQNPSIEQKEASSIEHLTLFGIAVGIVSLLYEHFSGDSHSHPPAAHRELYIRAAVHIDLPEFKLSPTEIQSALNAGIEQVTHAWDLLGWPRDRDLPNDVDRFLAPLIDVSSRCIRPIVPPVPPMPPVNASDDKERIS